MGCDIHMVPEYKYRNTTDYWDTTVDSYVNPGRHYKLFGMLAGVREQLPQSRTPKGIPDNLSFASRQGYYIYISNGKTCDECLSYTEEEVTEWIKKGYKPLFSYNGKSIIGVENPDWHSASWLSYIEFRDSIIDLSLLYDDRVSIEYEAMLESMRVFYDNGYETRVVFWFDN